MTRLHPRCGTSFLFVVVAISILLFALVSAVFPTSNMLVRMLIRLALLPFVVSISYECNRFVGRHDNGLTRALSAPGMWFQHFTTNEPDDSMLEVAIEAPPASFGKKKRHNVQLLPYIISLTFLFILLFRIP